MKTTFEAIREQKPCKDGWKKLISYYQPKDLFEEITIEEIIKSNGINDALWALRACKINEVIYFVGKCAEGVLPIFEKVFPDDDRPRKAVEICYEYPNVKKNAASAAARAASDASDAAFILKILLEISNEKRI